MITRSKKEVIEMLNWLNRKIAIYEDDMCRTNWANSMSTQQCERSRCEYAGWLAERNLLERIHSCLLSGRVKLKRSRK